jgi:hypothetical protein
MLHHVPNAGQSAWKGEYYDACVKFARTNDSEMKLNSCTLDQIKKGTPSSYFSGNPLWGKAQKYKRVTVNEIHTIFWQEVYWQPTLPLGTTALDPLMLELQKKLWIKKAHELKDGRVQRVTPNAGREED